jgi:hypothetical protein
MRRARTALMALLSVGLLTALVAGPVAADTDPAPVPLNVYLVGTGFSFTSGGIAFSGIGQIEEERISHQQHVSFYFAGYGPEVVCDQGTPDPSDDEVGQAYVEFFATDWKVDTFEVRKDLGKAELSVKLKGKRVTTDPCTGEIVRTKNENHVFSMTLKATAPADPETDVQIVTTDQGTFEVTSTFEFLPASGPTKLDGQSVSTFDGSIQHLTQAVRQL